MDQFWATEFKNNHKIPIWRQFDAIMTFLAFRPFRRRKHRNDVIVTSYIKISQILKLESKDITSKTLHAKFYASRIKTSKLGGG